MELKVEKFLNEMSMDRSDAIDRCLSLGEKFAEHFNKVMEEGQDSPDFKHHCHEMQVWFDTTKKITLKPKGKYLTIEYWIDWFFTAGQTVEKLIDSKYEDEYEVLIRELIFDKNKRVEEIVKSLFTKELNQ